jgi:transposase InsO family protein
LKTKREVFNKFKEFKSRVENISKKKRKTLRSNNGGEFTSYEFKALCGEVGIKRDLTTPYSPQQNDVAKRNNRTITVAGNGIVLEEHVIENHDMTEPQIST